MSWCSRCGEYELYGPCRCAMRGRVWFVENGEETAKEVWSIFQSPTMFLDKWAARIDANNCYEKFADGDERAVAYRPVGEGRPVQFLTIRREMEPIYYAETANKDSDAVATARHWRARDLAEERKRLRARRSFQTEAAT